MLLLGGCVALWKGSAGLFCPGSHGGQTWDSPEVVVEGSRANVRRLARGPSIVNCWLGAGQRQAQRCGTQPQGKRLCLFQKCSLGPSRGQTLTGCQTHNSSPNLAGWGRPGAGVRVQGVWPLGRGGERYCLGPLAPGEVRGCPRERRGLLGQ